MFERILAIILPVFLVVALGYVYGRRAQPEMASLNHFNVAVLTPLLIFSALASKDFRLEEQRLLLAAGAFVVLGSGLLAWGVARLTRESARALVPPAMFNNCGNMGLPLAVFAFGEAGLSAAVALFVLSNAIHFTVGVRILDRRAALRSLLSTPMMLATYAGLACALFRPPIPAEVMDAVELVGSAAVPMMLLALGVRMTGVAASHVRAGLLGAVLCPLTGIACAWIAGRLLDLGPEQYAQLMLFASLPPAVLNYILAERYDASPDKVAAMVLIGNFASIAFVPLGLALGLPR